jgi:type III pantothenate kinase
MPKTRTAARAARGARSAAAGLIAVDIGNSDTVVGRFLGERLEGYWRLTSRAATADEIGLVLDALHRAHGWSRPGGSVLCSVVPALTLPWASALQRHSGRPPVEASAATAPSLPIRYHDKSAVGADRIANAIAARALYGTPAIVVDLGTATTFDCISQQGAYLGGAIAPGVATSAEELFRRAARLPLVAMLRHAKTNGSTTERSQQEGVPTGRGEPRERLTLHTDAWRHAAGGPAAVIAQCEAINRVDEGLTLKGMRLIWKDNA